MVISSRCFFVFKRKTAYEMRISDWSSDVCSSDLQADAALAGMARRHRLRNRPVRRRVARSRVGVGAMQIKIEIDVRPEELRRFLGLPDVAGLQEDVVAFLRDKVGAATEFDPSQFVKSKDRKSTRLNSSH